MTESKLSIGQAIDQIINALEGLSQDARLTAVFAACKHLNVQVSPPVERPVSGAAISTRVETSGLAAGRQEQSVHTGRVDIRTLTESKKPDSARQMACNVAYYLQELAPESERRQTISTREIEKYFKQASFKLPKGMDQVLKDAKHSGYFESSSRGEYKLNAVGYNLVVHGLPTRKDR